MALLMMPVGPAMTGAGVWFSLAIVITAALSAVMQWAGSAKVKRMVSAFGLAMVCAAVVVVASVLFPCGLCCSWWCWP